MQQSLWRSKHYILSQGNRKKRKIEIDISWSSTLLSFYWVFDNMISRKKKRKFFQLALSVADERLLILDAENFEKLFSDSVKVLPMNNTIDCSYGFYVSFRICKWFSKLFFFSVNGSGLLILFFDAFTN